MATLSPFEDAAQAAPAEADDLLICLADLNIILGVSCETLEHLVGPVAQKGSQKCQAEPACAMDQARAALAVARERADYVRVQTERLARQIGFQQKPR